MLTQDLFLSSSSHRWKEAMAGSTTGRLRAGTGVERNRIEQEPQGSYDTHFPNSILCKIPKGILLGKAMGIAVLQVSFLNFFSASNMLSWMWVYRWGFRAKCMSSEQTPFVFLVLFYETCFGKYWLQQWHFLPQQVIKLKVYYIGSDAVPVLDLCFEPDHSFAVFALLVNSLSA